MRKIVLTLAALAAVGIALPIATAPAAQARDVVIIKKSHRDHGWNRGYRHRDRVVVRDGWRHRQHRGHGVGVVIR